MQKSGGQASTAGGEQAQERRRGRPRAFDREAALETATRLFWRKGYAATSVSDLTEAMGIGPPSLYAAFGSKEELFSAVLDSCTNKSDLMEGDRADFGRRMAHELVYGAPNEEKLRLFAIMLRSIGSPKAAEVVQRSSADRFFIPFAEWIGGEDAIVRARMVAGMMMGMSVSRDMGGGFGLSPEECERMCERVATTIQGLIDG